MAPSTKKPAAPGTARLAHLNKTKIIFRKGSISRVGYASGLLRQTRQFKDFTGQCLRACAISVLRPAITALKLSRRRKLTHGDMLYGIQRHGLHFVSTLPLRGRDRKKVAKKAVAEPVAVVE